MRTLDIRGDKPLPYFPIIEQIPFLGWRGIRISLDQPDLFKAQLRAMLRAGIAHPNLSILFPMISGVSELSEALELLRGAQAELQEEGVAVMTPRVGIMVEVPSAVYQIDALIQMVDFASIGSNDLTQYLLAVDRNNDRVAKLYDSLHPAVLKAIHHVIERVQAAGRPVSVCGEMAGDPAFTEVLLAMGLRSFSMHPARISSVKQRLLRADADRLSLRLPTPECIGTEKTIAIRWDNTMAQYLFVMYHIDRSDDGKKWTRVTQLPFTPSVDENKDGTFPFFEYRDSVGVNYKKFSYRVVGIDHFSEEIPSAIATGNARDHTPPDGYRFYNRKYERQYRHFILEKGRKGIRFCWIWHR